MTDETERAPDAGNKLARIVNAALAANTNETGQLDARDVIFACVVVLSAYIQHAPIEARPMLTLEAMALFNKINERAVEEGR